MAPVLMGRDLRFSSPALEAAYARQHNESKGQDDFRMALFRAPLWVVIGAKLWNGGERADAAAVVLSGETCLLVPMAQKLDRDRYTRYYRPALLLVVVLVQAILAHWRAELVWMEKDGALPSFSQVLIVAAMGNGVLFFYLTQFMSWHLWPWLLAQQSMVLVLDTLVNDHMCRVSMALQAAYQFIHSLLPRPLSNLLLDSMMSPAPRFPATLPLGPRTNGTSANAAAAAAACMVLEPPGLGSPAAVQVCRDYQFVTQVFFGFLLPLLFVFRWEVDHRRRWIRERGFRCVLLGGTLLDFAAFVLPVVYAAWTIHTQLLQPSVVLQQASAA